MAQRFKAEQLKEMIRALVREELNGAVKSAINELLSERYLRQLAEVAASRPRGVGQTMHIADGDDHEEEPTPRMLPNPTQGIYTRHPIKHDDELDDEGGGEPQITTIPEGVERNSFLATMFEGTKPLPSEKTEVEAVERAENALQREAAEAEAAGRLPLKEIWGELAGVKKQAPAPRASPEELAELEKREQNRLKILRESLERKV